MANLRISELDSAPMVSGTYVFPASSTDSTYKISFDQLSSWITNKQVKNNAYDYSLTAYDTKNIITFNNSSPVLFTIPNDTNQYVPIGTTIELIRLGGGIVNITGDSNITINSSIGWTLRGVYSKATVTKINGNTWIVSGDLALSPTPTPSVTPPVSATPTPTPTITVTPSITPTITVTPSITPTITVTPSITPSSEPFGPPAAPLNLSARGANEAMVLSWDYPLRDGRSSVTDYIVEYEVDPSVSPTPTMTSTPTPTPTPSSPSSGPFTPAAYVITSGTSRTVPVGATTMKAWVIGGGGGGTYDSSGEFQWDNGGYGGEAVKTYSVTGGSIITYSVGSAGLLGDGAATSGGNTTLSYNGDTIIGSGGQPYLIDGNGSGGDFNRVFNAGGVLDYQGRVAAITLSGSTLNSGYPGTGNGSTIETATNASPGGIVLYFT